MQRHTLLLNRFFSATTVMPVVSDNLFLFNDYYVNIQNVPDRVVNETNVRAFLEDPKNTILVNGFINYMTGSTTMNSTFSNGTFTPTADFMEIYYNDSKLSNLFNSYYQDSYIAGGITPERYISQENAPTQNFVYNNLITYTHNFYWEYNGNMQLQYMDYIPLSMINNIRLDQASDTLIKESTEQNYYIPVFIHRNFALLDGITPHPICMDQSTPEQIIITNTHLEPPVEYDDNPRSESDGSGFGDPINIDIIDNPRSGNDLDPPVDYDSMGGPRSEKNVQPPIDIGQIQIIKPHLVQCFVDLNFSIKDESFWTDSVPVVSFERNAYSVIEGSDILIGISITPAAKGNEVVEVIPVPIDVAQDDYIFPYPTIARFNAGDTRTTISFKAAFDYLPEATESLKLIMQNPFNVRIGRRETIVQIENLSGSIDDGGAVVADDTNSNVVQFDESYAMATERPINSLSSAWKYEVTQTAGLSQKEVKILLSLDHIADGTESVILRMGGTEPWAMVAPIGVRTEGHLISDYRAYMDGIELTPLGEFTLNWIAGETKEIKIIFSNDFIKPTYKQIVLKLLGANQTLVGRYMEYVIYLNQKK